MNDAMRRGRLEDARLMTGGGRYADDWTLPRQAHAAFVRADRAHARIVSLDASQARARPGVVAVLTGSDAKAAGFGSLPNFMPAKGRNGMSLMAPPRPVLAGDTVRFVGEAIAIVVAESRAAAQDAAALVEIAYEDLPPVVAAQAALAADAPRLHAAAPGNLAFEIDVGAPDAAAAALAGAHKVVRLRMRLPRVVASPMEPRSCAGAFDASSGTYTLIACIQGAFHMRGQLASTLGVTVDKVRVLAEDVGGSFGVRSNAYPEDLAVLLAARHCGRPVKWQGSRSESFLSDEQGRDSLIEGELGLDEDGRMLGMRFDFTGNLGAYPTMIGPVVHTLGASVCLSGVYAIPATHARMRVAYTNTVPTAAYRGAGRPLMSYAIERLVDAAAHEIGMDPAALRAKNFIPATAFPYKLANNTTYDCGDFATAQTRAMHAADWPGFAARRAEAKTRGRLRGIGMACYIEATNPGFLPADNVQLRVTTSGDILIHAATQSNGQGHATTFAQIVGSVLGLPVERIRLATSTETAPQLEGNLTSGSRSLASLGSVLMKAAEALIERGRTPAATLLGVRAEELTFREGAYRAPDGTSVALADLIARHAGATPHPLDTDFSGRFGATFPNGCHIAEVEIDPVTGEVTLAAYTACDDVGNVVNRQIVEGQVHGGLAQGFGEVFSEVAAYDEANGQLLTGGYLDYALPRAGWTGDAPGVTALHSPVPTSVNPLGAKGAGEAGVTGGVPALMNAVCDALRQGGAEQIDMPATPARVWRALRGARQRHAVSSNASAPPSTRSTVK
ncbi:MAG: xanthine dehydrogenase family protein molybdopterin-binding subunit [Burkholderiales bacterium]|nr:xanthine dehydrogenase family protein molybdopterin-binding subunit [Burkholderiales bacterium]